MKSDKCVICGAAVCTGTYVCKKCLQCPCKDCTERTVNCHDACENFIVFRKACATLKQKKQEKFKGVSSFIRFRNDSFQSFKQKNHRKR